MSLCCIGGVCIPYSALVPFLVYGLQWFFGQLAAWGVLPDALHNRLQGYLQLPKKNKTPEACCSRSTSMSTTDSSGTMESNEQWQSLLESNELVVAKFTASWCKPCKEIQPVFESLEATAYKASAFCVVDVDDLDEIASDYKVSILTTFLVFRQGKEVARYVGSNEQKLRDLVQQNL
jgi:thioredoxin 1